MKVENPHASSMNLELVCKRIITEVKRREVEITAQQENILPLLLAYWICIHILYTVQKFLFNDAIARWQSIYALHASLEA